MGSTELKDFVGLEYRYYRDLYKDFPGDLHEDFPGDFYIHIDGAYFYKDGDTRYVDARFLIHETENNSMKIIQNAALYVLALNCGIIAFWFGQYKPILNDFRTNHGSIKVNGERNGRPRTQIRMLGKNIGLNRFIILVSFLSKILIPFVGSITGKLIRRCLYYTEKFNPFRWKLLFINFLCIG